MKETAPKHWSQFLPGIWLGAVLFVFLAFHPLGKPLYREILPGLFRIIIHGDFPWGAWLRLIPHTILLSLAWMPWAIVGWIALWALYGRTPLRHSQTFGVPRHVIWIEWLTLAPVLGAAITSTPLVLLATFFLLSRWTVLAVLICSVGILWLLGRKGWLHISLTLNQDLPQPESTNNQPTPSWMVKTAWVLIGIISAWMFFHSLVFPVDYWDALIYYIHYAEMTYKQGGFPVLVQLQVGLGLGANYPHLYGVLQASQALLYGVWTDAYGQAMMPLAGLGTTLLLYTLVFRIYRRKDVAVLSALAFRIMPYAITYSVWCSDYSLVMYGTVAFLALLRPVLKAQPGQRSWVLLLPVTLIAAAFPQINYMGWIVWAPLGLAVILSHFHKVPCQEHQPSQPPAWVPQISILLLGIAWAAPWYIRNWIVTGNPVYAFFPEIFGGKHIDLNVLASCQVEWTSNGDGLAQVGNTFIERIAGTPLFFKAFWWKWAPLVLGLALPGALLGWRHKAWKLYAVAGLYASLVLFYGYVISGLYLYHMIALFPLAAFFGARVLNAVNDKHGSVILAAVLLLAGICPGVAFSSLGPKAREAGLSLLMLADSPPESFYRAVGRADADMWRYINKNLESGTGLLTHENRYHVFRRDLNIIHLDDWDLLPFYDHPWAEVVAELKRRGVRYYLQIPNEKNHPITLRLGVQENLNSLELLHETYEGKNARGEKTGIRRLYKIW